MMNDDAKTRAIVEPILADALRPFGLASVDIESDRDHDGDPIIRATVHYALGAPKIDARILLDAIIEAMNNLHQQGDDRFLHVRHQYADGEPAEAEYSTPVRRRKKAQSR